jgi:hypothetical protein
MSTIKVKPYVRLVPNGRSDQGKYRFALVASPIRASNSEDGFDLREWPIRMFERFNGKIPIRVREADTAGKCVTKDAMSSPQGKAYRMQGTQKEEWEKATAVWSRIAEEEKDWTDLLDSIQLSLSSNSATAAFPDTPSDTSPEFDVKDDGTLGYDKHDIDLNKKITIKSVLPVRQADIALTFEIERAQEVLNLLDKPKPQLRHGTPRAPLKPSDTGPIMDGLDREAQEKKLEELIHKKTNEEFRMAVDNTNGLRKTLLKNLQAETCTPEARPKLEKAAVEPSKIPALASHSLSTWPQSVTSEPTEENEIYAAYYAIQSSPVWSRYFGFVIDIEIGHPEQEIYYVAWGTSVTAIVDSQDQKLPCVWSAVGKTGWAPVDERGTETAAQSTGKTNANCLPRFDVFSLDARRIADGYRPSEEGVTPLPPQYATCGLALLDREKAYWMAKKLRDGTRKLCGGAEDIVLFADDWTIGYRLDVGIVKEKTAVWRSLMGRAGTYALNDVGGRKEISKKHLTSLLGTDEERMMLDESLLGSVSRIVPRIDGHEAVIEEMVAIWDGTPLSVYAGPDPVKFNEQTKPSKEEPLLPFHQSFSLDGIVNRPPPLRYGQRYRFGLRPVYLGGGSRSAVEAANLCYQNQGFCTPGGEAARRFVRHEPIGAPYVLLPYTQINDTLAPEMDYDRADAVILRSSIGPAADQVDDPVNGRPYVRPDKRVGRATAIRILVPPQSTHDEVLRAGKFDAAFKKEKTAVKKIQKGGLLNLAFGVDPTLEPEKHGTFPVATVEEKHAFGHDPTRISRGFAFPKAVLSDTPITDSKGTAIYIPKEKIGNYVRKEYLPDPHADTLVLRLRHRDTGQYLGGYREVPLYNADKGHVYPDALPTVVKFNKVQRPPSANVITFDDVATETVYTCYDGVKFGKVGQHVHLVEFNLSPADDFELEACYLPRKEILARQFAITEMAGAISAYAKGKLTSAVNVTTGGYDVPDDPTLEALAEKILAFCWQHWPIGSLVAGQTIRVTHAVNRPLAQPKLLNFDKLSGLERVRLPTDSKHPFIYSQRPQLVSQEGTKDYVLDGSVEFDLASTSVIEIMASCVSPRNPVFDDKDRSRSVKARVAGSWPKRYQKDKNSSTILRGDATIEEVYGFESIDPLTGKVELNRKEEVALLRVHGISNQFPADGIFKLDLAIAHDAARRGEQVETTAGAAFFKATQGHVFPDGMARLLKLRAVAVSRFAPEFETAGRWTDPKEGQPVVRLRQPLQGPDLQLVSSAEVETKVWLKSSKRPAQCAAKTTVPVFSFSRASLTGDGEPKVVVTRNSAIRVYMDRGWFSSGEGERLGLIIWPPNHLAPPSLSATDEEVFLLHSSGSGEGRVVRLDDFKDEQVGPGGTFITRWGGDPAKHDAAQQSRYLIPLKSFADRPGGPTAGPDNPHAPTFVPDVDVPYFKSEEGKDDDGEQPEGYFRCGLLTYEPCFDIDREQWFVDINIVPEYTPNQFVRLGLVRFQPHAISNELRCSKPVAVWSQLMPQRQISCSLEPSTAAAKPGRHVKVKVTGLAHLNVKPLAPFVPKSGNEDRDAAERRKQELALNKIQRPVYTFNIMHEAERNGRTHRNPVRILSPQKSSEVILPPGEHGLATWEYEAHLDEAHLKKLGQGRLYVFAEEREYSMPARYGDEPVAPTEAPDDESSNNASAQYREPILPQDMFDARTFVRSGTRFSARVDLRELM